jgi:hypothetical protein
MCCDLQGTRGDISKADDTYKMVHFDHATILLSGDVPAARELASRLAGVIQGFAAIPKPKDDFDLRIGLYLEAFRKEARAYKNGVIGPLPNYSVWNISRGVQSGRP